MAERLLERDAVLRGAALLALAAIGIWLLGRCTDVDLALADLLYDRAAGGFPWREAWLTTRFGHGFLKAVLTVLAACTVSAAILDAIRAWRSLARPLARLRLHVLACAAVLVPLATSLLKQGSNAHCPWDLARYGGTQPYVRLFEALPPGALPGHCLPAGHASSALWLAGLAVLWLPARPHAAWRAGAAALLPGLALGWMQQMRGAHFLTHTLWSAWIACAIVFALAATLPAMGARRRGTSGGTGPLVPAGTRSRAP